MDEDDIPLLSDDDDDKNSSSDESDLEDEKASVSSSEVSGSYKRKE